VATTIKEVARKAGVSIATVSRVLNDVGPVDGRTREHVRTVAREMHYFPNALGRSLSRRRTDGIGLLLPDLFGEFFSEVIRGADQTAQQNHYHLVVSSSHANRAEIEAALRMMRGRVDGLIVMSPNIEAHVLRANLPQSLPVVLLNCVVDGDDFDSLNVDNEGGAYQMVQHLISHGHQRIAIIKGSEGNFEAAERLRGYRRALEHGSAECDTSLEIQGAFSEASGYDAVRTMLALRSRPTAVFASNDAMAIGALSGLRDAGLRVPDDMALAGFDDVPIAQYLTPALTSVHVSISDLGVQAICRLIDAVREKNSHVRQHSLLTNTLALRESCGCTNPPSTTTTEEEPTNTTHAS
jgi:LacI family transcriptional regulator